MLSYRQPSSRPFLLMHIILQTNGSGRWNCPKLCLGIFFSFSFFHFELLQNIYTSKMQNSETLFQPETRVSWLGSAMASFMSRRAWVGWEKWIMWDGTHGKGTSITPSSFLPPPFLPPSLPCSPSLLFLPPTLPPSFPLSPFSALPLFLSLLLDGSSIF